MDLAGASAAVPPLPRSKPGAGFRALSHGGERGLAPVRPPGIPCVRFAPRPSVGRLGFAKGTGPLPLRKEGGCVVCFLGLVVFVCWVLGLGARIKVNEGCLFGKLEKVIFHENDYQLDQFA